MSKNDTTLILGQKYIIGIPTYKLNVEWLESLGFVKNKLADGKEVDDRCFTYYDKSAKSGFELGFDEESSVFWLHKFHDNEQTNQKEWFWIVHKMKIYSDDELYFVMSRIPIVYFLLGLRDKPIKKP